MERVDNALGVDEAGRGPVIGPLVLAVVRRGGEDWPSDLTLADSKKMTERQREDAFEFIRETLPHSIVAIPPWSLTESSQSLPGLEAEVLIKMMSEIEGDYVLCDRLSAGESVHERVRERLPDREWVFETGADDRYESVAAASVLAKVTRDRAMDTLSGQWGEVGSGYPSDPVTRQWLKSWYQSRKSWPPIVRTDWSTVSDVEREVNQSRMFDG